MKRNKLLIWLWFLWGAYLLALQAQYLLAPSQTIYHFSAFWVLYSLAAFVNVFGIYSEKEWARPLTLTLSIILLINTIFTLHYALTLGRIVNWIRATQMAAFLFKITVVVYSLKIAFSHGRRTAEFEKK
jgi:hypothetical protein